MATREQGDEGFLDHRFLPEDHLADFAARLLQALARIFGEANEGGREILGFMSLHSALLYRGTTIRNLERKPALGNAAGRGRRDQSPSQFRHPLSTRPVERWIVARLWRVFAFPCGALTSVERLDRMMSDRAAAPFPRIRPRPCGAEGAARGKVETRYCGEIDMRIAADGRWFYQGGPINRLPLVKLFASILRKDPERYVLVTPVERVGIRVDDAPFLAVEMEESETPEGTGSRFPHQSRRDRCCRRRASVAACARVRWRLQAVYPCAWRSLGAGDARGRAADRGAPGGARNGACASLRRGGFSRARHGSAGLGHVMADFALSDSYTRRCRPNSARWSRFACVPGRSFFPPRSIPSRIGSSWLPQNREYPARAGILGQGEAGRCARAGGRREQGLSLVLTERAALISPPMPGRSPFRWACGTGRERGRGRLARGGGGNRPLRTMSSRLAIFRPISRARAIACSRWSPCWRRMPFTPDANEVARLFEVPLAHVLDTRRYRRGEIFWRGRERSFFILDYPMPISGV